MDLKNLGSPVRSIRAEVGLYKGSTLVQKFKNTDRIKSFTIESTGANSFFGFGVCRRLNLKLVDTKREVSITTENSLAVALDGVLSYPLFYVTETNRDENTNELSVTAYDAIYPATVITVDSITLPTDYSIKEFAEACGTALKCSVRLIGLPEQDNPFDTVYKGGANFSGSETLREALDDVAEATQTIYYVDRYSNLVFRRLDTSAVSGRDITKNDYFTLKSSTNRRISAVCATTQLGDNVIAELPESGTTVYIRDNAFWTLRPDLATLVEKALAVVGGMTVNQFHCSWRGDFMFDLGDKLNLITKDNNSVTSYLLNDKVSYDGSFSEETQWQYQEDSDTAASPSSLGDALNDTFATVDKVNKKIDLVLKDSGAYGDRLTQLELTQGNINASVENIDKKLDESIEYNNQQFNEIRKRVDATITDEDVNIKIEEALQNGVDQVITSTGYRFDKDGLTVSKKESEMKTQISEDGMKVFRGDKEVLVANNAGVDAANLHATTYLVIGKNSRFEDYNGNRTGCFWIGR